MIDVISTQTGRKVYLNPEHITMVSLPGGQVGDVDPHIKMLNGDVVMVTQAVAEKVIQRMKRK